MEQYGIIAEQPQYSRDEVWSILCAVAGDFDLDPSQLRHYLNTPDQSKSSLCMARKHDGLQCTRKARDAGGFCGKHSASQKYGCMEEGKECISMDEFVYEGNTYLVDMDNIVYQYTTSTVDSKHVGDESLSIIGKRRSDGSLYKMTQKEEMPIMFATAAMGD